MTRKPWPPTTVAGNPTCRTTHWTLPVACAQPRGHRDNWHSGWTGPSGTRGRKLYRWRRTVGVTELSVGKIWQPTSIPGPNQPPAAADLPDCSMTTHTYVDPDGHILRVTAYPGAQAEVLITVQGLDDGLMVGASITAEAAAPIGAAILTHTDMGDLIAEVKGLRAAYQRLQYTARCASAILREVDANANTGRPQNIGAIRSVADALDTDSA
ncbi:hypothetical protein [Streptomyces sp. LS1784]|uniref:hypothetical protein n=1 Tax=Streptomyces sp. LS1784 TaxID=2851533 RepID=UPI001CCC46E6|nr:hypothetical protein [Streptomyces sp. LS1784]